MYWQLKTNSENDIKSLPTRLIYCNTEKNVEEELTTNITPNQLDLIPKNKNTILHLEYYKKALSIDEIELNKINSPLQDILSIKIDKRLAFSPNSPFSIIDKLDLSDDIILLSSKMANKKVPYSLNSFAEGFTYKSVCYDIKNAGYIHASIPFIRIVDLSL